MNNLQSQNFGVCNLLADNKKVMASRNCTVSFKASEADLCKFATKSTYKYLCSKERFNQILDLLEPCYREYFQRVLTEIRETLKTKPELLKSMSVEDKRSFENGHIVIPQSTVAKKTFDLLTSPFTYSAKAIKKVFTRKPESDSQIQLDKFKQNCTNLQGFVEFVESQEQKSPQEIKKLLNEKLQNNFKKLKANYSSNLFIVMIEAASAIAGGIFSVCDFYNITRRVDDDHKHALKEAVIKGEQEAVRLGVLSYLIYTVASSLKKHCNKSIPRALAIGASLELVSEVINRAITGRPFYPVNETTVNKFKSKEEANAKNDNAQPENAKKNVSFKGLSAGNAFSKDLIYSKNEVQQILEFTKKLNSEQAQRYITILEQKLSGALKGKKLTDIFADKSIQELTLGTKESFLERAVKCVLIPITAPINALKKLAQKGQVKADEFSEVENYFSYINHLVSTKYKGKDINDPAVFKNVQHDVMNNMLSGFSSSEANYNTSHLAVLRKIFSYAIVGSFVSMDAYNVTMIHSNNDKKKGQEQAKQRALLYLLKFFLSIYTVSAATTLFTRSYNKNIANAVGLTFLTSTLNNYLTRQILGIPVLPRDKAALQKFDEEKEKSKFHQFINKLIQKN